DSGALPDGLTLTGDVISGVPATGGTFTFTLKATNIAGDDTKQLSITVNIAPAIITASLPNGTVGTAYSQTLAATGDTPITWTLDSGALPDGLTLTGDVISGVPATGGTFTFTVKAENSAGNDTKPLSIVIGKATLSGEVTVTGTAEFGATLTAVPSDFISTPLIADLGTLSYQWKRGATNIGTNSATYTIIAEDIAQTLTVTVTAANCEGSVTSTPTATIAKAPQTAPSAPTEADKTATSVTLNAIPNAEYSRDNGATWQDGTTFGGLTPNTAYTFIARMKETATYAAGANSAGLTVSTDEEAVAPSITTASLSSGTVGMAYSQTLEASGDAPLTWTIDGGALPDGLALTGDVISGVPATGGIFTFTVKAANSAGDDTKQLSITVDAVTVYTVTVLSSGTGATGNGDYKAGATVNISAGTPPNGYRFSQWTASPAVTFGNAGSASTDFVMPANAVTLTAQWSAIDYSITYALNGGTNHADNPLSYTVESAAIILQSPTRAGYAFAGWSDGGTIETGSTGDRTFTAQWMAKIIEIALDNVDITGSESNATFEYTLTECGKTSVILNLSVSPGAGVRVNGEAYSSSGHEIDLNGSASLTVPIVLEAGDTGREYALKILSPINSGDLYYQRWDDVLAINVNPATNGGYTVSGIRWYRDDGTPLGSGSYIEIPAGSASAYYAEVETGGEWRRVCASLQDRITAYPNPVPRGEMVTLKLPESYTGSVLNIYNVKGALVKSGQSLPARVNSVDVSELVPGIHLLRVTGRHGNSETVKIVIE
ncbi:MAG: InlB B-repeat-containing protein, partial [Bacteroidales bacterium]|nr:InlB B-repeat-containing protein [Bacteroidales bacterium]